MKYIAFSAFLSLWVAEQANAFSVTSNDISEGGRLKSEFILNGFGCSGQNLSPQLSWTDLPAGTKSMAITMIDPDAPTGSGWRHVIAIDIPITVTDLPRGALSEANMPAGGRLITNDFSTKDYGGACPPLGHGMHRYQFTLWALPVAKLDVADDASSGLVSYMLNGQSLDHRRITAVYSR